MWTYLIYLSSKYSSEMLNIKQLRTCWFWSYCSWNWKNGISQNKNYWVLIPFRPSHIKKWKIINKLFYWIDTKPKYFTSIIYVLINDDELCQWLKLVFGLLFLQFEQVKDGFIQLMCECPKTEILETEVHVFTNYILQAFI